MKKLERFDREIMKHGTYYEVLDYVADYVQRFLELVLDEEIQIPVSVDRLLEKLEISVELSSLHNDKSLASIHFNGEPYILISKTVNNLASNQANWLKLKCIAKYIINIDNIMKGNRSFAFPEHVLSLTRETLPEILAYELMLPCKQSIRYFLEGDFFEKLNERYLWEKYGNVAIGECIAMKYPVDRKMFAYYHFMQTLEAKVFLEKVDTNQFEEFQEVLWDFSEKSFEEPQIQEIQEFIGIDFCSLEPMTAAITAGKIVAAMEDPFDF